MVAIGAMEILLILLLSAAGQSADAVSVAPPPDYFETRAIAADFKALADLAGRDPQSGKDQIGQLMALRQLGEDAAKWKKDNDYARGRKIVQDVAAGKIAQDTHGFSRKYARRTLALADGQEPPLDPAPPRLRDDAFSWFPASATLVGALDTRLLAAPQPTRIGYDQELFKRIPKKIKEEVYKHLETLGNVQIDRVALAVAAKQKGQNEIYVRVTGKVNRPWLVKLLKDFGVEMKAVKGPEDEIIFIHERRNIPPAVALIGDTDLLLIGYDDSQKTHGELLENVLAVRDKKQDSVAKGKLQAELVKIPDKACGLLLGSFPDDVKQGLGFGLGAQPEGVSGHVTRTQDGLDIELNLVAADAQQAMNIVKAISNHRDSALNALKMAPPMPDFPLVELRNLLQSIQIQADGAAARLRVLVANDLLRALPRAMLSRVGDLPDPKAP